MNYTPIAARRVRNQRDPDGTLRQEIIEAIVLASLPDRTGQEVFQHQPLPPPLDRVMYSVSSFVSAFLWTTTVAVVLGFLGLLIAGLA